MRSDLGLVTWFLTAIRKQVVIDEGEIRSIAHPVSAIDGPGLSTVTLEAVNGRSIFAMLALGDVKVYE